MRTNYESENYIHEQNNAKSLIKILQNNQDRLKPWFKTLTLQSGVVPCRFLVQLLYSFMHWLQGSASKVSLLLTAAIPGRLGKMMHGLDFYSFLLHTFIPWYMSVSQRKSLAKRFSKHDTLQKLVNCWYVCPSFSASDVSMAKSLQGLTGESRKCDGDLDVAHVTGWKVGGQLETERGERERVAAELRLLRWPDGGQTGL